MSPIEEYLIRHGVAGVQAAVWARFLHSVLDAFREAAAMTREPRYWTKHVAKKSALSKPRKGKDGRLYRLPAEEGLTWALHDRLITYRVNRPAHDVLRTMEVQFFSEARVRSPRRTGRSAPRVDIQVCSALGPRAPYVVFEAKIVDSEKTLTEAYLGPDGIGAFLSDDDLYPARHFAGMLAYTVSEAPDDWVTRIERGLEGREKDLKRRERLDVFQDKSVILFDRVMRNERRRQREMSMLHMVLAFDRVDVTEDIPTP